MERCPICRARLRGESLCPRCGSDLSLPLRITQQVQRLERNAVMQMAAGEMEQAENLLGEALKSKPTLFGRVLLKFMRAQR